MLKHGKIIWRITRPIGQYIKPFSFPLKVEINESGEVEHTFISFISKNQLPLIMVITEYIKNGRADYATCMKDTETNKVYVSRFLLAKELGPTYGIPENNMFGYFKLVSMFPKRFVEASESESAIAIAEYELKLAREMQEKIQEQEKAVRKIDSLYESKMRCLPEQVNNLEKLVADLSRRVDILEQTLKFYQEQQKIITSERNDLHKMLVAHGIKVDKKLPLMERITVSIIRFIYGGK